MTICKSIYLGACLLLAAHSPVIGRSAAIPEASVSCGAVLAAGAYLSGSTLDLSTLPSNITAVSLLDESGNVLAELDLTTTRTFDLTALDITPAAIAIACSSNAIADRRIIVY